MAPRRKSSSLVTFVLEIQLILMMVLLQMLDEYVFFFKVFYMTRLETFYFRLFFRNNIKGCVKEVSTPTNFLLSRGAHPMTKTPSNCILQPPPPPQQKNKEVAHLCFNVISRILVICCPDHVLAMITYDLFDLYILYSYLKIVLYKSNTMPIFISVCLCRRISLTDGLI